MEDIGLQRAILASMQHVRPAPVPTHYPRPAPTTSRGFVDIRPTVPYTRGSQPDSRAVRGHHAHSSPNLHAARDARSGVGRKDTLAREGVAPSASGDRVRSPLKVQPRVARQSSGRLSATTGSTEVSRRGNTVHGWADVCRGGRLQRQNPSGSHLQVLCEEGCEASDLKSLPASQCLLTTTNLPPELSNGNGGTIVMNVRMSFLAARSMFFGIVVNFSGDSYEASWVTACLSQTQGCKMYAQVLHCRLSEGMVQVQEELSHMAPIPAQPRPGASSTASLGFGVTSRNGRLDVFVNGSKLLKNIAVGSCHFTPVFGVLAAGAKCQVRDIQCSEGAAAAATATSAVSAAPAATSSSSAPSRAPAPPAMGSGVTMTDANGAKIDKKYAELIEQDILETNPNVQWEDIAALTEAKRLLNEAVVLPMIAPELFTGIRTPWQGVLLFGPPGTGKTLLAKAVATCANTTFFNMSASSLLSKWHGESEKMIRTLFQLARKHAPSTIFFDEIDALMMKRGDGHEHEASRRLKSELLSEMSGMHSTPDARIMILATSNKPWDLDEAFRRRLEKRIYIPLPEEDARIELFRINMKDMPVAPDVSFAELARLTGGYSGADIHQVCRDASMGPIRRLIAHKSPVEIARMREEGLLSANNVLSMSDFKDSLSKISPSVNTKEVQRYKQWDSEFASV